MDNTTVINNFYQDIECLKPVTQFLYRVNVFEILGTSHTEIRHSNMLAWLMDPNQNHGLGGLVLNGIIQLVTDEVPTDTSGFEIKREWNHIDLLAYSEAENYVLCIENKTYSGEHSNQLARYRELVETTFPECRKVYIFLTRKGITSSDPEHWLAVGYRDVLKVIEGARKKVELKPEVAMLLDHYNDTIMEMIGGNDKIRNLCAEIYRKHRKAIELIIENGADDSEQTEEKTLCRELYQQYGKELREIYNCRPGRTTDPINDMIHLWAEIKTEEGLIRVDPENTTDRFIRFTTKTMSDILPDAVGHKSGWNTENFYFYELRNTIRSTEHEVFLNLVVSKKKIPDHLIKMSDRIAAIKPLVGDSRDHRAHFATDHVFIKDSADEQTVMDQLDLFLNQALDFEREVLRQLGKD